MTLKFVKYEGLGNDFVVVDASDDAVLDAERARRLCDRHFGIGADGVLFVLPASNAAARARMLIRNADGSRPEMCGNGIRCVALHLALADQLNRALYSIETDAGTLSCELVREGEEADVSVAMGRAEIVGERRVNFAGQELCFQLISMGNPHAVVFDSACDDNRIDACAALVSGAFPGGSNVEFATTRAPNEYDLVVWERGVGRTLACGTGAAATAVAAAVLGRARFDAPLEVRLPGGPLQITVARETLAVLMRGPARLVFSGKVRRF